MSDAVTDDPTNSATTAAMCPSPHAGSQFVADLGYQWALSRRKYSRLPAHCPARGLSLSGFQLAERYVLVGTNVAGQSENPFGNDVAQNLIAAAGDPQARRVEERLLKPGFHRRDLAIHHGAGHAHEIDTIGGNLLQLAGADQFGDRRFRPRGLA